MGNLHQIRKGKMVAPGGLTASREKIHYGFICAHSDKKKWALTEALDTLCLRRPRPHANAQAHINASKQGDQAYLIGLSGGSSPVTFQIRTIYIYIHIDRGLRYIGNE